MSRSRLPLSDTAPPTVPISPNGRTVRIGSDGDSALVRHIAAPKDHR
jgi:hypothetical protein